MKTILLFLVFAISGSILFGQQAQFVTNTSMIKVTAVKNGEGYEWENKDLHVSLDYKTGEFLSRIKNSDLVNPSEYTAFQIDNVVSEQEYILSGTFPIEELIGQDQINQNYEIELQLENDELNIEETILFDMVINRPESGSNESYRTFMLSGTLYNDELNLPAFDGYNNEIGLWLIFSGYVNTR